MDQPLFSDLLSDYLDTRAKAAQNMGDDFMPFEQARARLNDFMGTPMPPFVPE